MKPIKNILLVFILASLLLLVSGRGGTQLEAAQHETKKPSPAEQKEIDAKRKAHKVQCPRLECTSQPIGKLSQQAVMVKPPLKRCYQNLQTGEKNDTIKGYECYNYIADKKKTDVETQYCPFNVGSGEFAWVNEKDQFSVIPNSKSNCFYFFLFLI